MILPHDLLDNPKTKPIFASLPRTKTIIDVGCGIRPCPIFECEKYICIEPHYEYVDHLRQWERKPEILYEECEAVARFPRTDTTVLFLDVIEHMGKIRGEMMRDLLEEFEHAIIFTPLGWYEQGYEDPDCWGLHGGFWQKHRSSWFPEDFPNWRTVVWETFHTKVVCGAFMAIR